MPTIDPSAPILWLLRGGKLLSPIPFVKILISVPELAYIVAVTPTILPGGGANSGDAFTGTDFRSPAIERYESSALGSTRII